MSPIAAASGVRKRARVRRLSPDRRGAVLAEFVVAIVPMLITFFSFSQLAKAYTAGLVMRHATTVAARYAMVAYPKCVPNKGAGPDSNVTAPAEAAVAAWASNITVDRVSAEYNGSDPYGDVKTTATFTYSCDVPLGGRIVCPGGSLTKTISVTLPHSGARYEHACN